MNIVRVTLHGCVCNAVAVKLLLARSIVKTLMKIAPHANLDNHYTPALAGLGFSAPLPLRTREEELSQILLPFFALLCILLDQLCMLID